MAEELAKNLGIWVSQYLSVFCLVTLTLMTGGHYLWMKGLGSRVRDLALYLASISVLTLMLTFAPFRVDSLLWPSVTWFCLSMLFILELLWIAYLLEYLFRFVSGVPSWFTHKTSAALPPHSTGTPYSRQ